MLDLLLSGEDPNGLAAMVDEAFVTQVLQSFLEHVPETRLESRVVIE